MLAIVLMGGFGCKDRTAAEQATQSNPPVPTKTTRLSLSINSKPVRVLDNAELSKIASIKPPPAPRRPTGSPICLPLTM